MIRDNINKIKILEYVQTILKNKKTLKRNDIIKIMERASDKEYTEGTKDRLVSTIINWLKELDFATINNDSIEYLEISNRSKK